MKKSIKTLLISGLCLNFALSSTAYADGIFDAITYDETSITALSTSSSFSDISGHWAESKILEAIDLGIVSGYTDKTFRPNKQVTRAEFATFLTNAIKVTSTTTQNFKDVQTDDWFYGQVQKSVAVGIFGGYTDNTFKPGNLITRQEAAKAISSTITTANIDGDGAIYMKDYSKVHDWAKPFVNVVFNKGYMMGYNGYYRPVDGLTRAEAVKIIYDILDNENIEYGFNITNSGESYEGAVVVGDLNILSSVGSGTVYINDVIVLGNINIIADKVSSVVLSDVKVRNVVVQNKLNPVKITCSSNINIENAILSANATIVKLGDNIQIKNTIIQ